MDQKSDNGVFLELHEMFGDCVPRNVINEIGNKMSWDVTSTVDQLIKYIEEQNAGPTVREGNPRIQYKVSECQENDRDVDVLIESENYKIPDVQARSTGAIRKQPRETPPKIPNFADFLRNGQNTFMDTTPRKASPVVKNPEHPLLEEVCKEINSGVKVMIIMRGLPGSGKTHLAEKIVDHTVGGDYRRHIFSSDDFFYDVNGVYHYNIDKLSDAHSFNQNNVFKRAYDGWSPIIVDNTNMRLWEMLVYCKYAIRFGYIVRVMQPTTPWAWNATTLSQKNRHQVPRDSIERMLLKYEKLNSENELLPIFGLTYAVAMPQFRHHPPIIAKVDAPMAAVEEPLIGNIEIHNDLKAPPLFSFVEKPQLSSNQSKSDFTSDGSTTISPDQMTIDWPTHEEDANRFWNTDIMNQPPKTTAKVANAVKDQRAPRKNSVPEDSLLQVLKESIVLNKDDASNKTEKKLEKHRKGCRNENEAFVQVRQIYPTISLQYLWDLFVNCKGDCEWTVDIILQEETQVPQNTDNTSSDDFSCTCDGIEYRETPWEDVEQHKTPVEKKMKEETNISTPQRQRNQRMKNVAREDLVAAKRRVEEMIFVKDEHLSDHVKKIRDIRRGIFPTASTSTDITPSAVMVELQENAEMGAYGGVREQSPSSETSDPDAEETVEVDLGDTLINHMENLFFDGSICEKPKDLKTTVFMPMSLLRQLHALWVESLFNQLDEQRARDLKEDEKYARMLQMEDLGKNPDLFLQDGVEFGDMADMEITWEAYKREQCQNTTPKDLASQLTRNKLYETFPEADRGFLDEILASNNYKFAPTVDLLRHSLGLEETNVKKSGLKIIEEIKQENDKINQKAKIVEVKGDEKSLTRKRHIILEDFEENRNKASYHTQLKTECYQKAQDAIRKNMPGVAGYYTQVANLHKKKIEEFNHQAANCIVEAHNLKQNSDMLDLHYLHVPEALVSLDLFLDRQINQLRTQKKPYKFVFVITGRGLHSIRGVATIKNNAKQRLAQRRLKCSEVNPGLLKVKIFYNSKMFEEF
ncbi:uncharacterized protein LOC129797449 [Lutzomyia longipalpis]|uniref:uncharacterized protein LOC129797449 n=1 Tax=Lutzomyia longipalpis TaxID=7200 RepID=UPI002483B4D6|nr:uncharacterized protein LOC129797449 [Lutzomyia longipalpis]